MSALARYFMNIGKNVAGYDKTKTQLTSELVALGMDIHFEDNLSLIDKKYLDKIKSFVQQAAIEISKYYKPKKTIKKGERKYAA